MQGRIEDREQCNLLILASCSVAIVIKCDSTSNSYICDDLIHGKLGILVRVGMVVAPGIIMKSQWHPYNSYRQVGFGIVGFYFVVDGIAAMTQR